MEIQITLDGLLPVPSELGEAGAAVLAASCPRFDVPVVAIDLESTGTNVGTDRIVQLSLVRLEPTGIMHAFTTYVNPLLPMPEAAAAVHHITDEMVARAPVFPDIAQQVAAFIGEETALVGYGLTRFDVPLLERELADAGVTMDLSGRQLIDVKVLYHRLRPRRLSDAYRDYCGAELADAHDASQDACASVAVLHAMLASHPDLPRSMGELAASLVDPTRVDADGKFIWSNGEAVFAFGKHRGTPLRTVATSEPDFLRWMLGRDFSPAVRRIITRALDGDFPMPSPSALPAPTTS